MRYTFLFVVAALMFVFGCTTGSNTLEYHTAQGTHKVTDNRGAFSHDRTETFDSTAETKDCENRLAQMGSYTAYLTCLNTHATPSSGTAGVPGVMGGYIAPIMIPGGGVVVPGPSMTYPGTMPVVLQPSGSLGGSTFGGGSVVMPSSNGTDTAALKRRVDLLQQAVILQQQCVGKSCPASSK